MASQGPNSCGTGANDTSIGTKAWSSVTNIYSSDNNWAKINPDPGSSTTTNYLKATNFGFTIPSGATIDGIQVEIERKSILNQSYAFTEDATVKLVKGGTISGSNLAKAGYWPTEDSYTTYGGASSLWGLSWTDSDINSSTFGVVISVILYEAGKFYGEARVDHIRITVYYTEGGGGGSAIKSVNGLAKASVKSVNGLAIASVKNINGLT